MPRIIQVTGREVMDSRGNPTVEADIYTANGNFGRACAPSGASTGSREALELRDGDSHRYAGKGVLKTVEHINTEIRQAILGQNVCDQEDIDTLMMQLDGTSNKSRLGANAILAVSLATAKAAANVERKPLYRYLDSDSFMLPVPMMNIINGGAHADNNLDFQEFMIIPAGAPTFSESLRYGVEVFHTLKKLLIKNNLNTAVGDEGGFAPNINTNRRVLDLILEAIAKSGYQAGRDIYIGLDVASSEFCRDGFYHLTSEKKVLSSAEFTDYLTALTVDYPIISIEDGMAENDWSGWKLLTTKLGGSCQLVGDDLFVTNTELLDKGINEHAANAILIKPNQIGTLTETIAAIGLAKSANYATIISHRSGETEDTTIADLAVGTSAGQIKTGSLCRSDRMAKYNQLLRIEAELGNKANYAGVNVFENL